MRNIFIILSILTAAAVANALNPTNATGHLILKENIRMPNWKSKVAGVPGVTGSFKHDIPMVCKLHYDYVDGSEFPTHDDQILLKAGAKLAIVGTYGDSWRLLHEKSKKGFKLGCKRDDMDSTYGGEMLESENLIKIVGDIFEVHMIAIKPKILD